MERKVQRFPLHPSPTLIPFCACCPSEFPHMARRPRNSDLLFYFGGRFHVFLALLCPGPKIPFSIKGCLPSIGLKKQNERCKSESVLGYLSQSLLVLTPFSVALQYNTEHFPSDVTTSRSFLWIITTPGNLRYNIKNLKRLNKWIFNFINA